MRLIDADALSETMYHEAFETDTPMQRWDSGCWIRYKMFETAVENAPTIEPEQRWIPCEERLPEENGRYLVTNSAWGSMVVDWNGWVEGKWLYPNTKPIAWMPLPPSYQGE